LSGTNDTSSSLQTIYIFKQILRQADYEEKVQFVCPTFVECYYVTEFCETNNQGEQTYSKLQDPLLKKIFLEDDDREIMDIKC